MSKPIEAIGVIKETRPDENRTPLIPDHIDKIKSNYNTKVMQTLFNN